MVILVVTLLTTAILFRSFDRSKNASNYRVNEVVLNAAAPALDRARAKLNRLFSSQETNLPGNTPADKDIAQVFETNKYTFGDETQLKLAADLDGNGIQDDEVDERLKTAWKFPVDTDNNGSFDSFTLYSIVYRTPEDNRARGPLEARSRPQDTGGGDACASGNGGGAGEGSWYPISGQLKKAFFTYVATVPITPEQKVALDTNGYKDIPPAQASARFEAYTGNKGFSALEMQQDQARLALDNNAVWYEDDLFITNVGGGFNLNGRVQANSNLMVGTTAEPIKFYQVSSPWSCYYTAENGKIVVAGNVVANGIGGSNLGNDNVKVHLFKQKEADFNENAANNVGNIKSGNVTTNSPPREVAYNTNAYAQRLNVLVTAAMNEYDGAYPAQPPDPDLVGNVASFPIDLITKFTDKYPTEITPKPEEARNLLEQAISSYFRERIRKVTFTEVPIDQPDLALGTVDETNVFTGGTIKAPREWMRVDNLNNNPVPLEVNELDKSDPLPAGTEPEMQIGDRILVGNGLPIRWLKDYATPTYADAKAKQLPPDGGPPLGRQSQGKLLDDLGDTSRSGFWEQVAANHNNAPRAVELAGGLRVVTGAGIYIDGIAPQVAEGTGLRIGKAQLALGRLLGNERSFLPDPPVTPTQLQAINAEIVDSPPVRPVRVVWPDTMPMYQEIDVNGNGVINPNNEVFKGDLQMRATVVYHYANGGGSQFDDPIACISSYYDPTNETTAKNSIAVDPANGDPNGRSNNGINYTPVPTAAERRITPALRRQAYMVFPDGRWVNPPLKEAIDALQGGAIPDQLSLEQKGAIDAANCALRILNGTATPTNGGAVPNYAIRERAFLDARQIKTIHKPDVEFDADGLTFNTTNTLIDRETTRTDIANPEQVKIATQDTLKYPANPNKTPTPAEYSLPIEQRQPLEIRVTELDLELLRTTTFGTIPAEKPSAGDSEYLLPYSGIIYASRDDALPDISDVDLRVNPPVDGGSSATDFKLDPSRRPNGIRLWSSGENGGRLSRGDDNEESAEEKGLILASNLPVYIKGDFNRHFEFGSTNVTEEFNDPLDIDTYDNFYTRGKVGLNNDRNPNFACRQSAGSDCNPGDQWRAARILSDAITLLSNNFRDGFRNEGNYDFNNNVGNLAVAARLKNGFWWNGFGTNYIYQNSGGTNVLYPDEAEFAEQDAINPLPEIEGSSYVMNGVTPIQRRTTFPAYKMEICPKVPVSDCGPQDWVSSPAAGTTAVPPSTPEYERRDYPRRVAFQRNQFGQLVLASGYAQPRRPDGTPITYSASASPPPDADNALWFWTTTDNADPSVDTSYNKDNLLYYLPDDLETVATERQMLLPGTPKFPEELNTTAAFANDVLNGTGNDDPSDYAVCIGNAALLNVPTVNAFTGGACPALTPIGTMQQALIGLADTVDNLDPSVLKVKVTPNFDPATAATPNTLIADAKVNVFDLANRTLSGSLTLDRGNELDPIFVIRYTRNLPMLFNNVALTLKGVDPNNIFWVARRDMRIRNTATNPLVGNFIGGTQGKLRIDNGAAIIGGRFLGFGAATGSQLSAGTITALTTTAQPLLVPVLQLHSPDGQPSDNLNIAFRSTSNNNSAPEQRKWLQKATDTDYNAVLVMGDTPARPYTTGGAENNGGLHNFPRFIENWEDQTATIKGSLIQYIKSKYATAPFDTVDLIARDNSLFFDNGAVPDYIRGANPNAPLGYIYPEASAAFKVPYYQPPKRAWGYDVGLLSQTPDLFSRRIAIPEAGTPNEFFREVGRDDPWIKTLLCAAEERSGGYDWALVDETQRPNFCQAAAPGNEYNDPAAGGGS
jgi:type II secretory pathway pseudopilin PulG